MVDSSKPYTPETLGERWDCSATTVRNMCIDGTLRSFRVGRLYRITAAAVAEHEATASVTKIEARGDSNLAKLEALILKDRRNKKK